uniref:Uncharacterized protein n=1 Tax=viral metagenome TaxID=1070528 RepID=A0A6C0CJ43_9ZZZZ
MSSIPICEEELKELISATREDVLQSYNSAKATNRRLFLEGDDKATAEYIYANQMEDAIKIVDEFYKNNRRVVSIQKKTKVGADGLMIEIAKLMTTHIDDSFIVNLANVRIITGMSNAGWEKDMKDKAPGCFKEKIFHHGQLQKADLINLCNSLIIIDEIDTGDKQFQKLHGILKEAGLLDVKNMKEHNNRFVFISATMIKELYQLYRWGDLHNLYKMTIPESYIGHKDFLEKGIIKEFYPLDEYTYTCNLNDCKFETHITSELKKHMKKDHNLKDENLEEKMETCNSTKILNADKWLQEDVLNNYGNDYRVHIVRLNEKIVNVVQNACIQKGVEFKNHTSADRLSDSEIKEFFKEPLTQHIVLGVKGFFRRANLIPNRWKLRIGATHELYTKIVDNNVQIQGLSGRMTGYWRSDIEKGHKTGPHRTSIRAVQEYEKSYNDPYGLNSYRSSGFIKKDGRLISIEPTMFSIEHVKNIEAIGLPKCEDVTKSILDEFESMDELTKFWKSTYPNVHARLQEPNKNVKGRYICSIGKTSQEYAASEIRQAVGGESMAYWGEGWTTAKAGDTISRIYVGYENNKPVFFLRHAVVRKDRNISEEDN